MKFLRRELLFPQRVWQCTINRCIFPTYCKHTVTHSGPRVPLLPPLSAPGSARGLASMLLYQVYDLNRRLLEPMRFAADVVEEVFSSRHNPLAGTFFGKSMAASAEMLSRLTRTYDK